MMKFPTISFSDATEIIVNQLLPFTSEQTSDKRTRIGRFLAHKMDTMSSRILQARQKFERNDSHDSFSGMFLANVSKKRPTKSFARTSRWTEDRTVATMASSFTTLSSLSLDDDLERSLHDSFTALAVPSRVECSHSTLEGSVGWSSFSHSTRPKPIQLPRHQSVQAIKNQLEQSSSSINTDSIKPIVDTRVAQRRHLVDQPPQNTSPRISEQPKSRLTTMSGKVQAFRQRFENNGASKQFAKQVQCRLDGQLGNFSSFLDEVSQTNPAFCHKQAIIMQQVKPVLEQQALDEQRTKVVAAYRHSTTADDQEDEGGAIEDLWEEETEYSSEYEEETASEESNSSNDMRFVNTLRPGTRRGASFDENSSSTEHSEQDVEDWAFSLRPGMMRGNSFEEEPEETASATRDLPPELMRGQDLDKEEQAVQSNAPPTDLYRKLAAAQRQVRELMEAIATEAPQRRHSIGSSRRVGLEMCSKRL